MSKASEEQFDLLIKQAKDQQMIQLYFLAVMPNGQALNVTARFMPEELEAIGTLKTIAAFGGLTEYQDYMESHGKKLAELMTRVTNPMIQILFNKGIELLQLPPESKPEQKPDATPTS